MHQFKDIMKLFGAGKSIPIEEQIVETILKQEDEMSILYDIFSKLPGDLVEWFVGQTKGKMSSNYYLDVDIARYFIANTILPGDLIINRNSNPKPNDLVKMGLKFDNGEFQTNYFKVIKVNFKEGTLIIRDLSETSNEGSTSILGLISVVDVVEFDTDMWKKTVELLNIDYDKSEIINWVKASIEFVETVDNFPNKEDHMKLLDDRVKLLESKS